MRYIVMVLLVFGLSFVPGHFTSAALSTGTVAEYLDLPDGFGFTGDEKNDPEIITIYQQDIEGDAFFFCLDNSSSMNDRTASGKTKAQVLRQETIRALSGLTKQSVVSVVFYSASAQLTVFGEPPSKMDAAGKAMMVASVASTPVQQGSCLLRGMTKTLDIAQRTTNDSRSIVLTADGRTSGCSGEGDPDQVFGRIMARNILKIPINAIYTGPQSGRDWEEGKTLLEQLARATNGKFRIAQ